MILIFLKFLLGRTIMACASPALKIFNFLGNQSSLKWLKFSSSTVLKVSYSSSSYGTFSKLTSVNHGNLLGSSTSQSVIILPKTYFHNSNQDLANSNEDVEETVEEHEQTIYKGILSAQIKLVKSFSLLTSVIGLSCQPILFMKMTAGTTASIPLVVGTGAFLSFFTFATPLLIHWVSKKYVVELVYNKIDDTYTAVTYSLLLRKKQVKFRLSDVNVPDIPGMFTTFKANNIPLFVDGHAFDTPQHFIKIMGYDKPLDLRWEGEHTRSEAEARRRQDKK